MEQQQECPVVKQFNENLEKALENIEKQETENKTKVVNDWMYYAYGMCYGKCSDDVNLN